MQNCAMLTFTEEVRRKGSVLSENKWKCNFGKQNISRGSEVRGRFDGIEW